MGEVKAAPAILTEDCYADTLALAFEAAEESPEPFLAGIEAVIEMAERDPDGACEVLWRLQGDWRALERMEEMIDDDATGAVLRLGAAIHVARAKLSAANPQPRQCLSEVLKWIYGPAPGAF